MSISEFHYITPLDNVRSIFDEGILSHDAAASKQSSDISMHSVQEIRATKVVPNGDLTLRIHEYANLYFNAKNPMLYLRVKEAKILCVLRIKPEVMKKKKAVVSTMNAAASSAVFYPAKEGVQKLNREILFGPRWYSKYWGQTENDRAKKIRCAELLVPGRIKPHYIGGAYVPNEKVKALFENLFDGPCPVEVTVNPQFFFGKLETVQVPTLSPVKKRQRVEVLEARVDGLFKHFKPIRSKPELIRFVKGDLFDSSRQTLVNTVNCRGVMGAGIAKQFKERFPEMFNDYAARCKRGEVQLGRPYLYDDGKVKILNFPTKDHWKKKSDLNGIAEGLKYLVAHVEEWGITSLAIPPLGCGLGKLNWSIVRPTMVKHLSKLNFKVDIYEPR